jgi:hypothetical protein
VAIVHGKAAQRPHEYVARFAGGADYAAGNFESGRAQAPRCGST